MPHLMATNGNFDNNLIFKFVDNVDTIEKKMR